MLGQLELFICRIFRFSFSQLSRPPTGGSLKFFNFLNFHCQYFCTMSGFKWVFGTLLVGLLFHVDLD